MQLSLRKNLAQCGSGYCIVSVSLLLVERVVGQGLCTSSVFFRTFNE